MAYKSGQFDGKENRMVSFRPMLEVLYFSVDVSDNPGGSTSGPPIQLGWEMIDRREVDIVEWESRERHGRKVLKIRNAVRVDILLNYGISLDDIDLYQKYAMTIRDFRKMSVKRVKWDRFDERKESLRRVLLQCRFSEAELPYPKVAILLNKDTQTLSEGADNTEFENRSNTQQRFGKRRSCPYFGVIALEMDDPNCENALMYNTEFTKVFRRASTSLVTNAPRHQLGDRSLSDFRRNSMTLARELSRRHRHNSLSVLSTYGDKRLRRTASDYGADHSSTCNTSDKVSGLDGQ